VAHACNPSYTGGRDQEDCSLKPARANSSRDPISKKPSQKRSGRVAQGVNPEFKPQHHKKKEKKKCVYICVCVYRSISIDTDIYIV
jgi:hypothetical protein